MPTKELIIGETKYDEIQRGMQVPFPISCGGQTISSGRVSSKFISPSNGGPYLNVISYAPTPVEFSYAEIFISRLLDLSEGVDRTTPMLTHRTILEFNLVLDVSKDGTVNRYSVNSCGGAVPGTAEKSNYEGLEATLAMA